MAEGIQFQTHIHADELATILAALRVYQQALVMNGEMPPGDVEEIATDGGTLESLDSEGVEDLCERLNCAKAIRLDV